MIKLSAYTQSRASIAAVEMAATTLLLLLYCFSGCLCLILLVRFLNKVWLNPLRIQSLMNKQGLKGPSYKFVYGNNKEILAMKNHYKSMESLSHDIFPKIQPHVYTWVKTYGMNFLSWVGPTPQIIITDPHLVKEVMNSKYEGYEKPEPGHYLRKMLGDGITVSNGEKWSKMRKLANHVFFAESLKNMIPAMIASAENMLDRLKQSQGEEVDIFQECKILTAEVISRTAFGSSYTEGQNIFEKLMRIAHIVENSQYNIKIPGIGIFFKDAADMESDKLQEEVRCSIIEIVKKREEEALLKDDQEVDRYGKDFLGLLIKAYKDPDESKRISLDDMADECKTFYHAGHETSSVALSWSVLLLAIHQDWQEKVRNEVLELFGRQNPEADKISKLKLMSMVINESLRLYPPGTITKRKASGKVKLGKLTVPMGMSFVFSILAMHHNSELWGGDVHEFKPERFAEGVAKATGSNMAAFMPFGLGPRNCVGSSFALTEIKIVLSMILQRYRITLSPTYTHSPVTVLTIRPQHGVQVILHPL